MPKLPSLTAKQVDKILIHAGFVENYSKSSHRQYVHVQTKKVTTVSFHKKAIPKGTLHAIIKQTGLSVDEFLSFRKKK